LAATRLADQREHLAFAYVQIDAVDCARNRSTLGTEPDVKLADGDQRVVVHADASPFRVSTQAARRPAPADQSSTATLGHSSRATAHRGWNEQPLGRSRGSGGSPPRPDGAMR